MRVRCGITVAIVMLAGCSAGPAAEQRYETVAATNDSQAICVEGRKVTEAYLTDGNQPEYRRWKQRSDVECNGAALTRQLGMSDPPATR
ncbi:hypothetical protein [Sphingomonas sp. PB4P5]|uniref:hypothetical protein n=1 Tax=Parasphingomonas puruogangriensis TaxID=3096155 RepID=UPI002FCA592D